MKHNWILFLAALVLFSCTEPEARRPVTQKTSTILTETLNQNKKLIAAETKMIENYIALDSTKIYLTSSFGFWYVYDAKVEEAKNTPKIGNIVEIEYDLQDLNGTIIYSKEELGIKTYNIDKEDFIPALQEGIKLMKVGETITFIIPSHRGFGLVGDENRIGINKTLKSTVTLKSIKEK
jgi:gliding motility-associated peptidyl-prolyl isomerase